MKKAEKTALYGIFTAIIVVLQIMSYFLKIGTFNLSLVLIPIVFGAYLYGPAAGAYFGTVFGAVVVGACAFGIDAGGAILFGANPFMTTAICLAKGAAAGFTAGLVCSLLKKPNHNKYVAIMLAAIIAPTVNTGLFVAAMFVFFKDILAVWAGGTDVLTYAIVGLVGVNFLIELTINVLFAPSLVKIKKAIGK